MTSAEVPKDPTDRLRPFLAGWVASGDVSADFRLVIEDAIRRRVGELLKEHDEDFAFDGLKLAQDISAHFKADLADMPLRKFTDLLQRIATELVEDHEPSQLTQCLWIWETSGKDPQFAEKLFNAMDYELRRRAAIVLRKQSFAKIQHKIVPSELVSELFLKLTGREFLRLPANKRQFYSLAETIIENLLRDMQKAGRRDKRPPSSAKLPVSAAGDAPLSVDLDQFLHVKAALEKLPRRVAESVRLQMLDGCTIEQIAEISKLSTATVKRDLALGKQSLMKLLS